jgi:Bacterial Ig-like domain (group 3)/RTX calcium-binding nonapeptide repeat (4 copies)
MKTERFERTKTVMATSTIALVVAALVIGVSHLVLPPRNTLAQHVGFGLASNPSTFTITSNIYTSPACGGAPALLYPGTSRCVVFTVQNELDVPITIQSITTALDSSYPAPPAQCAPPAYFTLPTFSGSAPVGADASAVLSGVPVELADSGSDQRTCENYTYHFVYTGAAQYTDSTTTSLTSSPNPSASGQSVSFTATVRASNTSTDGTSPTSGTVTFYSCTTAACGSRTQLGTETLGSDGQATYSTSTLPSSSNYIEAVYGGSGTNFGTSTSNVVTQTVSSSSISTTSHLTSSPSPSTFGTSVTFTDAVSASGTPTGTATFYSCTTSACTSKTSLGTGMISAGKATLSTSTLSVGTTDVEAVYAGSGVYRGSTSNVVAQTVDALGTTSILTSAPNPSTHGTSVTFTDVVSASSGTPTGTVTFDNCSTTTCTTKTQLGIGTLSGGKATYSASTLPAGTTYIEAVYAASGNYAGSTSKAVTQTVVTVPGSCTSSGYDDVITGTPADPFLYGTNGNDLMFGLGASYWINGDAGNDCIDAGDGNDVILDGNGNDTVVAGNGSDLVVVGNGNDKVSVGNGSDEVEAGNGADTVTLGNGSFNMVELGNGTDTVSVESAGSHDVIDGGAGNDTFSLGAGTYNTVDGGRGHNTCHLPAPPSSYHGTAAGYYHDTITNCAVVTP